jgi:hypothetical protein
LFVSSQQRGYLLAAHQRVGDAISVKNAQELGFVDCFVRALQLA